jgi:hypothetical protein
LFCLICCRFCLFVNRFVMRHDPSSSILVTVKTFWFFTS